MNKTKLTTKSGKDKAIAKKSCPKELKPSAKEQPTSALYKRRSAQDVYDQLRIDTDVLFHADTMLNIFHRYQKVLHPEKKIIKVEDKNFQVFPSIHFASLINALN